MFSLNAYRSLHEPSFLILHFVLSNNNNSQTPLCYLPGAVARSEACSLGMQVAPSSIPTSDTFFRGDLVMKKKFTAIPPLLLIQEEQLSVTGERMCTKYW